jgi:hypothetical protein
MFRKRVVIDTLIEVFNIRFVVHKSLRTYKKQWLLWAPSRLNQKICASNIECNLLFAQTQCDSCRFKTRKYFTEIS